MPRKQHYATGEVLAQVVELRSLFDFSQLPPALQEISRPFGELAERTCKVGYWSFQTVEALRGLLIAKDAAVRASVIANRILPALDARDVDDGPDEPQA